MPVPFHITRCKRLTSKPFWASFPPQPLSPYCGQEEEIDVSSKNG